MTDRMITSETDEDPPETGLGPGSNTPQPVKAKKGTVRRGSLVRVISESAALIDVVAIMLTAFAAELIYSGIVIQAAMDFQRTFGLSIVASLATVGMYAYLHLYRSECVLRPRYASVKKTVAGWVVVITTLIVMAFLTKTSEDFSRGWVILWAITTPATILSGRLVVRKLATWMIGQGRLARYVAIVGAGSVADRLALHLRNRSPELVFVGVFDDRSIGRKLDEGTLAPVGTTQDLVARGQDDPLDEIIITVPMNAHARLDRLLDTLAVLPVDIRVCLGMPLIEGAVPRVTYLDDMPLLSALTRPISEWSRMAKAAFDRVTASLLLVLLAPLMALIALAVRIDSKGPALFRQRRHGFNHEIITVLKFRTMNVMEDGGAIKQAHKGDYRITRLGAFLRRTSLDELPQLINVVRGDMSLVGPRPHALSHNNHYAKIISNYVNRHRVKPGITGLAQVNGLRGETDTPDKMANRIKYDLYYIDNWSIWLDIRILFRTAIVVFSQSSAY